MIRKISVLAMAALVGMAGFTSCSDDSLDTNQYNKSGVNILGFGPMPITRGETMRVTGTNLNNVKEVLFPEGNQKITPATTFISGSFQRQNSEELTVTIPDQCVPGKLRLLTNDGKTVESVSNITFAEEIKVATNKKKKIHPGDILTIKGEYVWNIGQVVFFDFVAVNAEDFIVNTRNEIQVRVPMEAKTGEVVYNDGSEGAENISLGTLDIDAAEATGVSNATPEFGETITITGENLDLVTRVDFPAVEDATFNTAEDGKSITVQVPSNTVSGSIVLTSYSGLTTSVDITMPLATVSSTDPVKDVKAGQTITIKGEKLDRITQLVLPAIEKPLEKGEFRQSASEIAFVVPEGMGDGRVILIQHENYSVESDKISMYSDAPETTIWSGNFVIGNWNAGMQDLAWGGYDWSTAVAGQVLTIYLKPDMSEGWSQIRVGNGSWAALPGTSDVNPLTGEDTKFSVTLTQAMIDEMVANGGLVICGAFFTVSKITLSLLENVLWQGQAVVDDWGNQPYILSDGGPELLAAGMKVGSVIRCYLTPTDATWNCQVWDGHWGAQFDDCDFSSGNWNLAEHEGAIEFKVTDAIYKSITSAGGWGGAFLLNGDNCICTKVSIK